jgi:transposase
LNSLHPQADWNRTLNLQPPALTMKKRSSLKTAAPTKTTKRPGDAAAKSLPVINPHAAGIDIGATEHYVCVPADAVPNGESPVRQFGAFTAQLDSLVEWLRACGVTTVAMEATGVYWIALFQKIEAAGLNVILVNARHLKQVPGRKTDVKDCQWIQRLHSYGLLNASFRPTEAICRLRTLMRHRSNLIVDSGQQLQHIQAALQQMNIHLHHVISDINGDTGLRILDAILAGERNPKELVKLRDPGIRKSTVAEMEAALHGDWREEHLWVLQQALAAYRFFHAQIAQGDEQIEKHLVQIAAAPTPIPEDQKPKNPIMAASAAQPKRPKRATKGNAPAKDLTAQLTRICGLDLTRIAGLNMLSVLILISEIGVDMSKWRNAKAFSSWLGLCPGNKISGGKVLNSKTAHVVNRISTLLRTMAIVIGRTDTWLGSFHRRMRARLGPAEANTATARKLACLIYHLLKYQEPYIEVDRLLYEEKIKRHRLARLRKQANELGCEVVEIKEAA